ncbi:MafB family polymorphic toxin [Desulfosarcina sp. OttesenSCG-928-G17]|nr:MafB family polymorphic toxin [Desulfosarcina sp. OttesenSCG-928-G17]
MKIFKIFMISIFILLFSINIFAQNIINDSFLKESLDRSNWEPNGKYFSFGNIRGTIDSSTRTGELKIVQNASISLGNFSLESAAIYGNYGFIANFSNHGYGSHSPFSNTVKKSDSAKNQSTDGSQTSYSINWTGIEIHPADGYDGPQGGGYPKPAGARDIYSFSINGKATGTYLISTTQQQLGDRPGFWDRVSNTFEYPYKHFLDGVDTISAGFSNIGTSGRRIEGVADVIIGLTTSLLSPVTGVIESYAGYEISETIHGSGNISTIYGFNSLNIELQYATLEGFKIAGEVIEENKVVFKLAEAASIVTGAGYVAKNVAKKGLIGSVKKLDNNISKDGLKNVVETIDNTNKQSSVFPVGSSKSLSNSLEKSGVVRPPNTSAHHIVASNAKGASEAREILNKFNISINDASNGVFLPSNKNSLINSLGNVIDDNAALHSTLHTNKYYDTVNDLLRQAQTKQEVLDTLDYIQNKLLDGTFPH